MTLLAWCAVVGAVVATLTFLTVLVRAMLGIRKRDMEELRSISLKTKDELLAVGDKDMREMKVIRGEDMQEIRGNFRGNEDAHRRLAEASDKIVSSVVELTETVALQNSRVGKLETWKDDHQKDDDRAHSEMRQFAGEHSRVLQDIASIKASRHRRAKAISEAEAED
jgi:hypothetical protein